MKACLIVVLLVVCVYAGTLPPNPYFKPDTWKIGSLSADDAQLSFKIFLVQENLEHLDALFHRLTTPGSPEWRHWRSLEELKAITAPAPHKKALVHHWLTQAGITEIEDFGDAYRVSGSIKSVSELLQTRFYDFTHIASGTVVSRQVGQMTIPAPVKRIVEFITGVTEFPYAAQKSEASRKINFDQTTYKVVPYVIDQLYGIPWSQKTAVNQRSSVGVIEYQGDNSFNPDDLSEFQQANNLIQEAVPTSQIIGPYNSARPDGEATLDIQYAWGVSYNTSAWYWTVDGWLLDWCLDFQAASSKPSVVSMSWGWTEDNQCEIANCVNSRDYVERVNTEYKTITMSGVTMTASSGDQGAPGDGDTDCRNHQQPLSSIFPGSSPYVLSIGATMLVTSNDTKATARPHYEDADTQPVPPICSQYQCADPTQMEEVACSYPDALITTGGGFSTYTPRPSWQNSVVTAYLTTVPPADLPPALDFNATNRGFPDVSALGHNYLIRRDNSWELVDGTSCSAPVWAGLIALWNDFEIKQGRPTLGFINPLIYQIYASNPQTFFDIQNGNNKCTESECCEYGYATAAGWDPVTGLGSPNFSLLYSAIQSQSSSLYQE